jgi:hypothetical protein
MVSSLKGTRTELLIVIGQFDSHFLQLLVVTAKFLEAENNYPNCRFNQIYKSNGQFNPDALLAL